MKGYLTAGQLSGMKREELQALAKDMGVSAGGKNEEIIARITSTEIDVQEDDLPVATSQQEALPGAAVRNPAEQGEPAGTAVPESAGGAGMAAGPVTVRVVTIFRDRTTNQIRDPGEVYAVSRERAEELVAAGVAEIRR